MVIIMILKNNKNNVMRIDHTTTTATMSNVNINRIFFKERKGKEISNISIVFEEEALGDV